MRVLALAGRCAGLGRDPYITLYRLVVIDVDVHALARDGHAVAVLKKANLFGERRKRV